MQRLYLQFYATILLVLAVFVAAALLTWRLAEEQTPQYMDVAAELTGALLPDADAPPEEDQKALDALHRKLRFDLALNGNDIDALVRAFDEARSPAAGPRPRVIICDTKLAKGVPFLETRIEKSHDVGGPPVLDRSVRSQ